jgi:predicted ATPase
MEIAALRVATEAAIYEDSAESEGSEVFAPAIDASTTLLSQKDLYGADVTGERAVQVIAAALRDIHVHLPFEVMPAWAARALDRKSALRASAPLAPANRLEKLGLNLANAFHALKNNYSPEEWQRTLGYIRLGLGEQIEDISTLADPGGGSIGLSLKRKNLDRQIPASQLSDGMLSYLAFVALFRLQGSRPSLVALDEPDLHLHPRLLMRVLDMFEAMARDFPVLVATHSDRLLDGLSDPARSVVLCELDEKQATRLYRPDPRMLEKWLERYRGLGDIRGAGHEASVLTRKERA